MKRLVASWFFVLWLVHPVSADLYFLGIAVDRFPEKRQSNSSIRDYDFYALNMQKVIVDKGSSLRKVHSKVILGEKATRTEVMDAIKNLKEKTTEKDVVILYISAHGAPNLKKKGFGICLAEFKAKDAENTALWSKDLKEDFGSVKGQLILIIDTCSSGSFLEDNQTGDMAVICASKHKEAAYGTLCKVLVDGLHGQASRNGGVHLQDLAEYTRKQVTYQSIMSHTKKLQDNVEHPVFYIPKSMSQLILTKP